MKSKISNSYIFCYSKW